MGTPEWAPDAGLPEDGSPQRTVLGTSPHVRGRGSRRTAETDLLTEVPDTEQCRKENLPNTAEHELEFLVPNATSYASGEKIRSPPLVVRDFRFRILVFPAGTSSAGGSSVSAFVEADPPEGIDPRWIFNGVKYQVVLVHWTDYRRSVHKADCWNFSKDGIDRGWHEMVRTAELSQETGWLGPNDSLCFRACCCVRQAESIQVSSDYNCRKETGFVGLMNHGATCYMNGLLQSLFHAGEFRHIVYSIDTEKEEKDDVNMEKGEDEGDISLIQALQNVFYKLQTAETAVNCKELMKSFGWDTTDAFTQHDAQELNRILCDRLEENMKGTKMDGSIKRLFEGEMENYIECLDVDYTSKRTETFYDIQLNIKSEKGTDLQTIEESLREFTADEMLDGDNLYEAEGFGKQRAKKGIRFVTFPPVLNLQLKRFHFDMERMDMVKLNSRFEFPRRLDMSQFAPHAGHYLLHSVVVHSGDVNSGHYYAYIRPNFEENLWVKFDDDNVTPCSDYAAVEDNFGGCDLHTCNYFDRSPAELRHFQWPTRPRIHNAYMLVYIREDCAADVLKVPDPVEVNKRMVDRCNAEVRMLEQRRREKMELQNKLRINLVLECDLCTLTGFWDHNIPTRHSLEMTRDQPVKDLILLVAQYLEVNWKNVALFALHYRVQARTVRFDYMAANRSLRSQMPQVTSPHYDSANPTLVVLCVAAQGYEIGPAPLRQRQEDLGPLDDLSKWDEEQVIMLVVKYFCVQTQKIITLGCYYMSCNQPLLNMVKDGWVQERLETLDFQVAPLPPNMKGGEEVSTAWEVWEEYSERDMQPRNPKKSPNAERLWCGDIVVWQQNSQAQPEVAGEVEQLRAGQVAPTYPVHNVADLAEHQLNSIDLQVTLMDSKQPMCIDGVVMNGHWGSYRPSTAQDGGKEETPEDLALAKSPAVFKKAETKELRMDLRWKHSHVVGVIAEAFGLKNVATAASIPSPDSETFLWFFQSSPFNGDEPLPVANSRQTLKEIQRHAPYVPATAGRKPLSVHVVEMPFRPGAEGYDSKRWAFGVRFFDSAVREVGSTTCILNGSSTVEDLLETVAPQIQPEWKISAPLRVMEVIDGIATVYRPSDLLRNFQCSSKLNLLYHAIRVEEDPDATVSNGLMENLVEVYHCDRSSQQAFGQPFFLPAVPGERVGNFKARCKEKLGVPEGDFKTWRLVRIGQRSGRQHLKDDEILEAENGLENRLCLEHVHPNPSSARVSRYNKPLTIK